jgi:starch synthase (maltosyl-transferring)
MPDPREQSYPRKNVRVAIENVSPEIGAGRYAIKRTPGERVVVESDIFADGHDVLSAVLKFRPEKNPAWSESPMEMLVNDRWRGEFSVSEIGTYFYTLEAWVDHFKSWRRDLKKKLEANQDVSVDLLAGANLIEAAAARAKAADAEPLAAWAKELRAERTKAANSSLARALDPQLAGVMAHYPDRRLATIYEKELRVTVDRPLACFGAWYEMFPRSTAPEPGRPGTFRDCEAQLPRVAEMGFDILYLPPIHPIGRSFRKGKNNHPNCQPGEPGSP